MFICLIGIDGSGKTTAAQALVKRAESLGLNATYTWGKYESIFFKILIRIKNTFFVRERDWRENFERSRTMKTSLFANRFAAWLYETYLLVSYWFKIVFKVGLPLLIGKDCICDRYVYDTFVDLAIDLGYSDQTMLAKMERYMRYVPKPDIVFHFSVPATVAMNRKGDIPSRDIWNEKSRRYHLFTDVEEIISLDGTLSVNALLEQIEIHLADRMRRKGV
jgi:thymidylate kinase